MATVTLSGIITPSNIVTASSTETLTNKTLTAPIISSISNTDATADKTAWAVYRMTLRDIPAQAGFPQTITWPDAP